MALTPERMADFLAAELIDDLNVLANSMLVFDERWTRYGEQYEKLLSPERRAELEAAFQRFVDRIRARED